MHFSYRKTVRYWGMFSLADILNITQVVLFYSQVKIWEMQKSMNKVKCIHNLIPRDKFSMGKPYHIQSEASSHPKPCISNSKNTTSSLTPSSHQCQPHLAPEWITGGFMTMAKSFKLDLSCHICLRHYHLTFVRKTPRDWMSLIEGLPHTMYSA